MFFKASKSAFKKTLSTIHIYVGLELSKWLTCIPPADQSELSLHRTIYGYLFRQNIRWSFFCSKEFYKKTKTKNGKGMWKVNRVLQGSPLFMDWVVANHLRPRENFVFWRRYPQILFWFGSFRFLPNRDLLTSEEFMKPVYSEKVFWQTKIQ